ncbi:hypothetical protein ACJX0J_032003, partial [Zea mays]
LGHLKIVFSVALGHFFVVDNGFLTNLKNYFCNMWIEWHEETREPNSLYFQRVQEGTMFHGSSLLLAMENKLSDDIDA